MNKEATKTGGLSWGTTRLRGGCDRKMHLLVFLVLPLHPAWAFLQGALHLFPVLNTLTNSASLYVHVPLPCRLRPQCDCHQTKGRDGTVLLGTRKDEVPSTTTSYQEPETRTGAAL